MIILDVNVLLYAYDMESPQHAKAASWLEEIFNGSETVGLPWQTIHAFLRIRTNMKIGFGPASAAESFAIVNEWLGLPGVVVINPGQRHAAILEGLMAAGSAYGPVVSDAVIAALALENGGVVASADRDFSRFPDLRWVNPLA